MCSLLPWILVLHVGELHQTESHGSWPLPLPYIITTNGCVSHTITSGSHVHNSVYSADTYGSTVPCTYSVYERMQLSLWRYDSCVYNSCHCSIPHTYVHCDVQAATPIALFQCRSQIPVIIVRQ